MEFWNLNAGEKVKVKVEGGQILTRNRSCPYVYTSQISNLYLKAYRSYEHISKLKHNVLGQGQTDQNFDMRGKALFMLYPSQISKLYLKAYQS